MAYSPPQADTVHFHNNGVGADASNAYGCTKQAWIDSGYDRSKFMKADGDCLKFGLATYTHNDGGKHTLSATGIGHANNCTLGILIGLSGGDGPTVTAGRYEVTEIINDNKIEVADMDATGDDTNVVFYTGGANNNLDNIMADVSTDAADYNREVLTNTDISNTETDIDTGGGSVPKNTWKRLIGCSSDFIELVAGSYVTLSGVSGVYNLKLDSVYNIEFRHLKFSDHPSGPRGSISIGASGECYSTVFKDCYFKDNTRAFWFDTSPGEIFVFVDCIFENNTATSNNAFRFSEFIWCYSDSKIWVQLNSHLTCCVFDGDSYGVELSQGMNIVENCTFYGQTEGCIRVNQAGAALIEYNNIFQIADAANDYAVKAETNMGTIVYSDYSITNSTKGGVNEGMSGEHCIKEATIAEIGLKDPANDDFRLETDSLAWNAGAPTLGVIE